jgi:hypothetical protein
LFWSTSRDACYANLQKRGVGRQLLWILVQYGAYLRAPRFNSDERFAHTSALSSPVSLCLARQPLLWWLNRNVGYAAARIGFFVPIISTLVVALLANTHHCRGAWKCCHNCCRSIRCTKSVTGNTNRSSDPRASSISRSIPVPILVRIILSVLLVLARGILPILLVLVRGILSILLVLARRALPALLITASSLLVLTLRTLPALLVAASLAAAPGLGASVSLSSL